MSTDPVPLRDPCCAMCLEVVSSSGTKSRRCRNIPSEELQRRINLHFIFRKYVDVERGLDEASLHQFDPFPFCQECQSILEQLMEQHQAKENANRQITSLQAKVFGRIVTSPEHHQDAAGSDEQDMNYAAGVRAFRSYVSEMFSPKVRVTCLRIDSTPTPEKEEEQDVHHNLGNSSNTTFKETEEENSERSSSSTCSAEHTNTCMDSTKFDSDCSPASASGISLQTSDEEIFVPAILPCGNVKNQANIPYPQSAEAMMFSESELDGIVISPEEMEIVEGIVGTVDMV